MIAAALLLAFVPGPSPLPDLHWSPVQLRGRDASGWNALLDDRRAYELVGPIDRPWLEGIAYDPPLALPADVAAMRRLTRYAFTPVAGRRLSFSYGVVRGEARSWVWQDGTRVVYAGRGDRRHLADLAEWTWTRHFRPAAELAAPVRAARLPHSWFR